MIARKTFAQGFILYPFSMAGHIGQGAVAAAGSIHGGLEGIVTGATWTVLYIAYQGMSAKRKADSPGLDIADYMFGYGLGLAGAIGWRLLP